MTVIGMQRFDEVLLSILLIDYLALTAEPIIFDVFHLVRITFDHRRHASIHRTFSQSTQKSQSWWRCATAQYVIKWRGNINISAQSVLIMQDLSWKRVDVWAKMKIFGQQTIKKDNHIAQIHILNSFRSSFQLPLSHRHAFWIQQHSSNAKGTTRHI